jgi:hypothetical protein
MQPELASRGRARLQTTARYTRVDVSDLRVVLARCPLGNSSGT